MRQRAQEAGNLLTTEQQTVTSQDSTIIIEPASPEVVYVPEYDPWLVYGGRIEAWRDGTSIPESGMAGCTRRTESASESASTEDMGGAGVIGDLTGITGP